MPEKLLYHALNGNTSKVAHLISQGINIHYKNESEENALILASKNGHAETVRLLLEAGAYLHTTNKTGQTPLIIAAMHCHTETVKIILEFSKKTSSRTSPSAVAIMAANSLDYKEGCSEVVHLLRSNPG